MSKEEMDISIVIPAYNEEKRLPLFLERLVTYCSGSEKTYEIVVVDDASSDKTAEIVLSFRNRFLNLTLIQIQKNRGKGYAVKRGMLKATGKISVFLDADGSVDPQEIEKNLHYILRENYDIFVGSRVLKDDEQVLKVKRYRKLIGIVFNFLVQSLLFKNITDTQCGFKMFHKKTIEPLFSRSYLGGFGFDVEVLYLAYKMGYKVKEGPVSWHHVNGSKVNLVTDSIKMFFNILQTRNWHCTPINIFDKYMGSDEYEYMYNLESYHWWFVSRKNLVVKLIKSVSKVSPYILDVGCGTGGNLLSFKKLGRVCGIDISQRAVDFCRKRGLNNVSPSEVEKIIWGDKSFDIITCLDVLEHVMNPIEALMEMKRVLKDQGRIIITVPAFRMLWSQHDEALCHLRRYEKQSLVHDLQESGLKINNSGYFFFLSFFIVAPIRIMRRFILSDGKTQSDTTTLPPKLMNEFLKFLFFIEIKISSIFRLPFGTTIYAVVSKQ